MKNFKTISIIFLLLICNISKIDAQKTAYENKLSELTQKYIEIIYGSQQMSMTEKLQLALMTSNDESGRFILGIGILAYEENHTEAEVKKLVNQIEYDFKQAEKLKTSVDFNREKAAKIQQQQEEYKRKLRAEQEAYGRTDAGSIENKIRSSFDLWNQKGEFEKQSDYEIRLQNESQIAYNEICIEEIKSRIHQYERERITSYFKDYDDRDYLQPIYDAENESFTVKFRLENGILCQGKIHIPISDAKNFKENWSKLDDEINDYDWCFINDELCPTSIILYNGVEKANSQYGEYNKYPVSIILKSQKDIIYPFNNIGIKNPYLKGYVFSYSVAKALKIQKDSLTAQNYNNKLDSALQSYNNQLLSSPNNIDKLVIEHYDKILANEKDKETSYQEKLEFLSYDFDKIKREINKEETQRVNFFNFLEKNSEFIKTLNFQKEKKEPVAITLANVALGVAMRTEVSKPKDYTVENRQREEFIAEIEYYTDKPYYPQIIDFVVKTNNRLNKEWTKNGKYFENKIEFYKTYLSNDYKKVLREKIEVNR